MQAAVAAATRSSLEIDSSDSNFFFKEKQKQEMRRGFDQ
jgi:hypothetical protein